MMPDDVSNLFDTFKDIDKKRPKKVFKIDWENNRLLNQRIDGKAAVEQAVQVYTAIEYRDFVVMPDWFGIALKDIYGMPRPFVKANLERLIKAALSVDERIERVYDFTMEDIDYGVKVEFTVDCVEGTFSSQLMVDLGGS